MKSFATGIIALALAAVTAPAQASVWDVDSVHSSAEFSVRHMMVSTAKGRFDKITGTVNLDDKNPTKSTVEIAIDPATIDTHEAKRDEHLKSGDFFNVTKFSTITFKSTKIEKAGKAKFKVTGDLTMHGVTKPITLTVEGPTPPQKNIMSGAMNSGVSATGKINRKDWGLTWNKPLEAAGGMLVGDEVSLAIDLELAMKPDAPAAAAPAAAPAAPAKAAAAAPVAAPAKTAAAAPAPATAPAKK
jgi:polyisoprenoid-binding protein YceI